MTFVDVRTLGQLLQISDLDACRLAGLLDVAAAFKREPLARAEALAGRSVACYFARRSTSTRVSFEAAIHRLGGLPVMLRPDELQLGEGEPVADTARVLSSYCDALVVGAFAQAAVAEMAAHSAAPVINALTDEHHPCQALADCLTLRERFGRLAGLELAYLGEDAGVCHSLIESAPLTGLRLRLACPPGRGPDAALLAAAGDAVTVYDDPEEAAVGAHAVYAGPHFRVTTELMRFAARDAIVLHAYAAAADGPRSAAWRQTANRLPTEQAVLYVLVTQDWEL